MVWNERLPWASSAFSVKSRQRVVRARRAVERLLVDALARDPEHDVERDAGEREQRRDQPEDDRSASSHERGELGFGLALRREDQIADLARRARAARQARAPVRALAHPRMRVGDRDRETRALHDRQIRQIIAGVRGFVRAQASARAAAARSRRACRPGPGRHARRRDRPCARSRSCSCAQ